ncbi:MAG: ferredoxin--NADP(+) reductase [Pelagibacteraceae bacterium TMED65]|nr:ferredoxin--NADP(+) reductase [Rickettsiales bacterium]OUU50335.1 MAG: ferredoxin--NADP(+) reductase [Pelagibacteraceae bacterium TMED65]
MDKIETDVLIIGAGPIGLFSVFELGQLGMKSCVIDTLDIIGGQCSSLYPQKPIYDIPAFPEISADKLIKNLYQQMKPFKPDLILGERVERIQSKNGVFTVSTSKNNIIISKCIIIAAGNGAFGPNKPPISNIEEYEEKSIFYHIKDKSIFKNKNIAIAGGGDSAADWAIELSEIANKIFFVHRREKLRAAPNSVSKLNDLATVNKLEMIVPYQIDSLRGNNGHLESLTVKNLDGNHKNLEVDYFLPFFGLSSDLGPIKDWELQIEKNLLEVNQSTCQTSKSGIYGVGDICTYPGKLKLILTGFSEAAMAAHSCFKRVFPEKVLHFEYSTTSGVKSL